MVTHVAKHKDTYKFNKSQISNKQNILIKEVNDEDFAQIDETPADAPAPENPIQTKNDPADQTVSIITPGSEQEEVHKNFLGQSKKAETSSDNEAKEEAEIKQKEAQVSQNIEELEKENKENEQ